MCGQRGLQLKRVITPVQEMTCDRRRIYPRAMTWNWPVREKSDGCLGSKCCEAARGQVRCKKRLCARQFERSPPTLLLASGHSANLAHSGQESKSCAHTMEPFLVSICAYAKRRSTAFFALDRIGKTKMLQKVSALYWPTTSSD